MGKLAIPQRQVLPPGSAGSVPQDLNAASYVGRVLATGSAELSRRFEEFEARVKKASDTTLVASRVAAAKRGYLDEFARRSQDMGRYKTLVQDMETFGTALVQGAVKESGDGPVQARITSSLNTFVQAKLADAQFLALKQRRNVGLAWLDAALVDTRAVLAQLDPTDPSFQVELAQGMELINASREAGIIDPTTQLSMTMAFASGAEEDVLRRQILSVPEDVYAKLSDASNFPNLSPETRTRLLSAAQTSSLAAQRMQIQREDRAERRAAKEQKRREDAFEATWRAQVRNEPAYIDQARADLENARESRMMDVTRYDEMSAFLDQAQEAGGFDVLDTVQDLRNRIYLGELEGVVAHRTLLSARIAMHLSDSTFKELSDLVNADPPALKTPDARAAARQLREMLGQVQGVIGTTLTPVRIARANAEFYQRVAKKGEDPFSVVAEMIPRYTNAVVNTSAMEEPRFPTINAAIKANLDGIITDAQLFQEAEIHRVRDARKRLKEQESAPKMLPLPPNTSAPVPLSGIISQ